MSSKSLLTYGAQVFSVQQTYYAPTVLLPITGQNLVNMYCLLAKVDNWADDNNPDQPKQDQKTIKNILNKAFVAKKITSNNIIPVIKRNDWVQNTVYDFYQDDVDMFDIDQNGEPVYKFYVKNHYDQVFKCLWNNNGEASTVEPYFEPGSYGTNNIFQGVDGYKWKYMYTVDNNLKLEFMDKSWMPVKTKLQPPNAFDSLEGYGGIEVINVVDGGDGYDQANAIITVSITGDGTGAAATAVTTNNSISEILVTATGTNYTYANVSIVSALGANSNLICPVSPIGGHAYDPISELGCRNVMLTCKFDGSESGMVPTDIDYRQLALIVNPVINVADDISGEAILANGAIYKTSTDLIVAPGFGNYINDEYIFQGNSLEESSFSAVVLSFDVASNIIKTINTKGTMVTNVPVFGESSKTVRTLMSYTTPEYNVFSGNIFYIENRSNIQRSSDGIEQFKIVLGY